MRAARLPTAVTEALVERWYDEMTILIGGQSVVKWWILFLVLAVLVAIFAIQNARLVPVHFLWWTAPRTSLSLLILLAALIGALVGVLGGFVDRRRHPDGQPRTISPAATPPVSTSEPAAESWSDEAPPTP
jgi:uncharacterized integral membrane protein